MITVEQKDLILNDFVNKVSVTFVVECSEKCKDFNLSKDQFVIILDQFEKRGLIKRSEVQGGCLVSLTADAFDLARWGGFVFEEDILSKKLEKVKLELEQLQAKPGLKNYVKQIAGITAVISDIISAIDTIRS